MFERWGVVLAGGRSRRMGRDKAALLYRGRPLVEHMSELLRQAGAGSVLVSGNVPGHPCIPDTVEAMGPLGGLRSVLDALPPSCRTLVVVPIDMPLLEPAALLELSRRVEAAGSGAAAFFEGQELPAAFTIEPLLRPALDRILRLANPQDRSMRALLRELGGDCLPSPEDAGFVNVNTPRDWEALPR